MGFFVLALPDLSAFSLALLVLLVTANLAYRMLKRNARLQYPPGPKPKFLIGNALDFPKSDSARVFAEWGKNYNSAICPSMIASNSCLKLISWR